MPQEDSSAPHTAPLRLGSFNSAGGPGDLESEKMAESFKTKLRRRAVVIAERLELELTVAGTEYAPLERAVFKSSKNNTKAPKEKHVVVLTF